MKRIYILISVIIITFISYLFILFLPKDYTLKYKINNFEIIESYILDKKIYQILVSYDNRDYPLIISDKYNKTRKIIKKIDTVNVDNEKCLTIVINDTKYPVCYSGDKLMDFRLLSEKIQDKYKSLSTDYSEKVISTYKQINIYNYYNKKIFVWNYKGYDYLSKKQNKTIDLLKEDNYNNSLAYKNNKYLITPNYDDKYYFKELLVINNEKVELSSFDLKNEIAYSSYYLGEIKDNIYLVDKKNKNQYKINIKKESIKKIGTENKKGQIYTDNDNWEEISLNKLINNEYTFPIITKYNYQIIEDNLYLVIDENNILLSKNKIKDIVYINDNEVYYLVGDCLYAYSPRTGEVKLIENNEWNFNYKNMIFIFD